MKLTSQPMSSLQTLCLGTFVVVLGFALAIVSAQESQPDGQSPKANTATPDPVVPVPAGPVADSKMPDISGTWRVEHVTPKGEKKYLDQNAVIRRSKDGTAFLVMGEKGVEKPHTLRVKWSETTRRFDGECAIFAPTGRTTKEWPTITYRQSMRMLADGKTMLVEVDIPIDAEMKKKLKDEHNAEIAESNPQVWTRIEKTEADAGQDSLNAPTRPTVSISNGSNSGDPESYVPPHDPDAPANAVELPSLEGVWQGGDWGTVKIELQDAPEEPGDAARGPQFGGTYHDIKTGRVIGTFVLTVPKRQSSYYEGIWKKDDGRKHGRLSVRALADGKTIRGSWTTDTGDAAKSDRPDFGDLEWVRIGRIVSEFVPDPPESPTRHSVGGQVEVFTLENSSAVECSKHLKRLYDDVEITADSRSNSIRIVSPFESRLRAVAADLQKFDKSQPKTNRFKKVPTSSFTPSASLLDVPGAFELLVTLAQYETMADLLAEKIRQFSNAKDDQNSQQVEARRDLEQTLTDALQVKFKLEQMQIKLLDEQLELLKTQVSQRNTNSKQIVKRRAHELIEGASRWIPTAPATTDVSPIPHEPSPRLFAPPAPPRKD